MYFFQPYSFHDVSFDLVDAEYKRRVALNDVLLPNRIQKLSISISVSLIK